MEAAMTGGYKEFYHAIQSWKWKYPGLSIIKVNWGTPFQQNPFVDNLDIKCAHKLPLCVQAMAVLNQPYTSKISL